MSRQCQCISTLSGCRCTLPAEPGSFLCKDCGQSPACLRELQKRAGRS